MPPERGSAAPSSATESAPQRLMSPPSSQHAIAGPTACSCAATVAGTRKMPLPIVMPTTTAVAPHGPSERGMRSPQWSAAGVCVSLSMGVQPGLAQTPDHCLNAAARMPAASGSPRSPPPALISFEQRLDVGALGLDRLEERHVLPGGPAVDDRREGDPAAVALAQIAGDSADGSGIVQRAGLQRDAVEPRRAALAQEHEGSITRHYQTAVERGKVVRVVVLVGEQAHEVIGGE